MRPPLCNPNPSRADQRWINGPRLLALAQGTHLGIENHLLPSNGGILAALSGFHNASRSPGSLNARDDSDGDGDKENDVRSDEMLLLDCTQHSQCTAACMSHWLTPTRHVTRDTWYDPLPGAVSRGGKPHEKYCFLFSPEEIVYWSYDHINLWYCDPSVVEVWNRDPTWKLEKKKKGNRPTTPYSSQAIIWTHCPPSSDWVSWCAFQKRSSHFNTYAGY